MYSKWKTLRLQRKELQSSLGWAPALNLHNEHLLVRKWNNLYWNIAFCSLDTIYLQNQGHLCRKSKCIRFLSRAVLAEGHNMFSRCTLYVVYPLRFNQIWLSLEALRRSKRNYNVQSLVGCFGAYYFLSNIANDSHIRKAQGNRAHPRRNPFTIRNRRSSRTSTKSRKRYEWDLWK